LRFMLVAEGRRAPPGGIRMPARQGGVLFLEKTVHLTGDQIESATAVPSDRGGSSGGWEISFKFKPEGRKTFSELTTKNVNRRLAIVLDDQVQSAPNIEEPITGGEGRITGTFKREEAEDLAACLVSGELPCPVRVVDSPAQSDVPGGESNKAPQPK